MILTFGDKDAKKVFEQEFSNKYPPSVQKAALRKLVLIDNAKSFVDLRQPPSNHLEKLHGALSGYFSIRVNRQYRLCFRVHNENQLLNVQLVDYH